MKDSIFYLFVLLALGAILNTFSLFKNDNYDEESDGYVVFQLLIL